MNEPMRKPSEWTDDEVIAACLDYSTRTDILRHNESAYICICYRDLWPKLTWLRNRHSSRTRTATDEELIEQSKKFTGQGRGTYQKECPNQYALAYRRGLLDSMPWLDDPQGRTTHELLESSRAYKSFAEFMKKDPSGYQVLRRRGALDAATWLEDTAPDWVKAERTVE